jgi:high frequency lysogenization protein
MSEVITNRAIALAGVYQSVELVCQIAWRGQADHAALKASLASVFKLDAQTYEAVYNGAGGVAAGLRILRAQLVMNDPTHKLERTRYAVLLLYLEKKLMRDAAMVSAMRAAIEQARELVTHFEITHINVISRLADIYQRSIGRLQPQVIVRGERSYLANTDNASRIRALLLAGIRAAVLWRQAGGNRWRLIVGRQALLHDVEALLSGA